VKSASTAWEIICVDVAAMADFGIESAAARSRLVGCGGIKQIETCSDLELGVVVGERVKVEVVGSHELLQIVQLPHTFQVAAENLGAGAV
jgi:hypothetical protein